MIFDALSDGINPIPVSLREVLRHRHYFAKSWKILKKDVSEIMLECSRDVLEVFWGCPGRIIEEKRNNIIFRMGLRDAAAAAQRTLLAALAWAMVLRLRM